jgi:hypothetical protein
MSYFFINLNYVPISERFDLARFMNYTDNFDPLTPAFFPQLSSLTVQGTYIVQFEVSRPDLLSYTIYQDTQYWWIIMLFNGLTDADEVVEGLSISFPGVDQIEDLLFSLQAQQIANGSGS